MARQFLGESIEDYEILISAINALRIDDISQSRSALKHLKKSIHHQSTPLMIEYLAACIESNLEDEAYKVFKSLLCRSSKSLVLKIIFDNAEPQFIKRCMELFEKKYLHAINPSIVEYKSKTCDQVVSSFLNAAGLHQISYKDALYFIQSANKAGYYSKTQAKKFILNLCHRECINNTSPFDAMKIMHITLSILEIGYKQDAENFFRQKFKLLKKSAFKTYKHNNQYKPKYFYRTGYSEKYTWRDFKRKLGSSNYLNLPYNQSEIMNNGHYSTNLVQFAFIVSQYKVRNEFIAYILNNFINLNIYNSKDLPEIIEPLNKLHNSFRLPAIPDLIKFVVSNTHPSNYEYFLTFGEDFFKFYGLNYLRVLKSLQKKILVNQIMPHYEDIRYYPTIKKFHHCYIFGSCALQKFVVNAFAFRFLNFSGPNDCLAYFSEYKKLLPRSVQSKFKKDFFNSINSSNSNVSLFKNLSGFYHFDEKPNLIRIIKLFNKNPNKTYFMMLLNCVIQTKTFDQKCCEEISQIKVSSIFINFLQDSAPIIQKLDSESVSCLIKFCIIIYGPSCKIRKLFLDLIGDPRLENPFESFFNSKKSLNTKIYLSATDYDRWRSEPQKDKCLDLFLCLELANNKTDYLDRLKQKIYTLNSDQLNMYYVSFYSVASHLVDWFRIKNHNQANQTSYLYSHALPFYKIYFSDELFALAQFEDDLIALVKDKFRPILLRDPNIDHSKFNVFNSCKLAIMFAQELYISDPIGALFLKWPLYETLPCKDVKQEIVQDPNLIKNYKLLNKYIQSRSFSDMSDREWGYVENIIRSLDPSYDDGPSSFESFPLSKLEYLKYAKASIKLFCNKLISSDQGTLVLAQFERKYMIIYLLKCLPSIDLSLHTMLINRILDDCSALDIKDSISLNQALCMLATLLTLLDWSEYDKQIKNSDSLYSITKLLKRKIENAICEHKFSLNNVDRRFWIEFPNVFDHSNYYYSTGLHRKMMSHFIVIRRTLVKLLLDNTQQSEFSDLDFEDIETIFGDNEWNYSWIIKSKIKHHPMSIFFNNNLKIINP